MLSLVVLRHNISLRGLERLLTKPMTIPLTSTKVSVTYAWLKFLRPPLKMICRFKLVKILGEYGLIGERCLVLLICVVLYLQGFDSLCESISLTMKL